MGTGHRFSGLLRGRWKRALAALSLPLLAACSALPTPVVLDTGSFLGMNALVSDEAPDRPLHVLIVHGMGTPAPYYFEGFIKALADRFGLVQTRLPATGSEPPGCYPAAPAEQALAHPVPQPISIDGVPPDAAAQLYTYAFGLTPDGKPKLIVSYLLWAPLTESIKCGLAAKEKGTDMPSRQVFANFAKDFIDDKLADVVLYGGTYRESVMRPSVQAALCIVIDGKPSSDGKTCQHGGYSERTVIITHRLGGYMMMDAIDDELRGERAGAKSAARTLLENTQFIYMMANQLALLDLTTLEGYPRRLEAAPTEADVAERFARRWAAIKLRSPVRSTQAEIDGTPHTTRQIVAFSDPNDILSWRLKRYDLKLPPSEWKSVKLTNVYLSNAEFSVPLLFSDPATAHTGYFDNQTVIDMLVCGTDNGAVEACPQTLSR
jgi:hypothetical protein